MFRGGFPGYYSGTWVRANGMAQATVVCGKSSILIGFGRQIAIGLPHGTVGCFFTPIISA